MKHLTLGIALAALFLAYWNYYNKADPPVWGWNYEGTESVHRHPERYR